MKILIINLFFFLPLWAIAQFQQTKHTLYLGNDSVQLIIHHQSDNGLVYFNMHDDENICVSEGLKILSLTGGKLVELKHFGEVEDKGRSVSFNKNGKIYSFDPNRIFSDVDSVRAQTLLKKRGLYQAVNEMKRLKNKNTPSVEECMDAAKTVLKPFADTILAILDTSNIRLLVALHNNYGAPARCENSKDHQSPTLIPESYNLNSYIRKNTLENESCTDIYINPRRFMTGFFIVTSDAHFQQVQRHRCNVVLQSSNPPDDGSLSVYTGQHHINYINIEAQQSDVPDQIHLLDTLRGMLLEMCIYP